MVDSSSNVVYRRRFISWPILIAHFPTIFFFAHGRKTRDHLVALNPVMLKAKIIKLMVSHTLYQRMNLKYSLV